MDDLLQKIELNKNREIYVKIISFDFNNNPIDQIEGISTAGNVNLDGNSSVRRTCTATLIANDAVKDYHWALKTHIQLKVGLKNELDLTQPPIFWINLGHYYLTSFQLQEDTSHKISISLQGKDKMCMLNGELGGVFPHSIDFGITEITDKYGEEEVVLRQRVPIKTIIREMLHEYGGEPFHNIKILDLEDYSKELTEYRGDSTIYLLRNIETEEFDHSIINGEQEVIFNGVSYSLNALPDNFIFDRRLPEKEDNYSIVYLNGDEQPYTVATVVAGEAIGYKVVQTYYPGDLIASVGETITSILDKICKVFGNFEYFYDVDGVFIFQEKKNYINNSWNSLRKDHGSVIVDNSYYYASKYLYDFSDNSLFTSFSNVPLVQNLKNDFSVWGQRTGITGDTLPIHMRYSLKIKPTEYTTIAVSENDAEWLKNNYPDEFPLAPENYEQTSITYDDKDWRELIYLMAQDYRKYNHLHSFEVKLQQANPWIPSFGKTGYEMFYTDMLGFWRQLYLDGDPTDETVAKRIPVGFSAEDYDSEGWNKNIKNAPYLLNFWIEFMDPLGTLDKYTSDKIGLRSKAETDASVTAVYYPEIPNIIFVSSSSEQEQSADKTGYVKIQLPPALENLFVQSSQGISATDKIDDWLFNYAYCADSVSISGVPLYELEPNNLIRVINKDLNVENDYLLNKVTLPLNYNGTMSINATVLPLRFY